MSEMRDQFGFATKLGPKNLWEAAARLARVRDEQEKAIRDDDVQQFNRLLSEQAIVWAYVKTFARRLIQQGKAPEDMIERLRRVLHIHEQRDQELQEAERHLAEKLPASQDQATEQDLGKAA